MGHFRETGAGWTGHDLRGEGTEAVQLFKSAKPLLTWREPWLFAARTRDRRGWLRRGALALLISAGMMVGFAADKNLGRRANVPWAGGVLISVLIGAFLTSMLDAPDFNRDVTISDDNINSIGIAGPHVSMSTWALRDVQWVRLIPPEEFGRSFGAMEFQTGRYWVRVGVPASMPMARIADVLHSQGVSVALMGWEPRAPEADRTAEFGVEAPAATVMPLSSARVERLGEGEAGRILRPFHFRLALAMYLGPLAATAIPGLVLCAYAIYRVKVLRAAATVADAMEVFGGLGLIMGGFWFTQRLGNFLPAHYLRTVARSVIERRPATLFDPRDPDSVCVDVIPRANWGKSMTRNATDMGLVKVDLLARCLPFEGDQERWQIPAASLISAEVESYRPASHVEGQQGGEVYFVTVIRADVGGQVWEAPVSKFHVELRPKTNRLREANAIAIRDRISEPMPAGAGPTRNPDGRTSDLRSR
jgi:hypothetical protein